MGWNTTAPWCGSDPHEAFRLQLSERFAHGGGADAEAASDAVLAEPGSPLQHAHLDLLPEALGHDLRRRVRLQRLRSAATHAVLSRRHAMSGGIERSSGQREARHDWVDTD